MTSSDPSRGRPQQVFISYAQADKEIARRIADELRSSGLRVWFDEWELKPGDSIASRIDQAVSTSDMLLVLLSPRSIESRWVQSELNAALSRELKSRAVTVIPALIEECEIPPLLADRLYLDLRSNLERGVRRLVEQIAVAPDIDFSRLDGQSFENLIADLLTALGFRIVRQPISQDSGFDFQASLTTRDPFGAQKHESWLVEVKLYRNQRVSIAALRQMVSYMLTLPGPHKGLVVTNSQLTSVAQEFLTEMTSKSQQELRVIDGTELTNLLLQHPNLVEHYFSREAQK
jgi:hypothetical protein